LQPPGCAPAGFAYAPIRDGASAAGGKKLPERDALTMAYNAVSQGAAGVDMDRNIFQSETPKAMIAAVNAVVHKNVKPSEALDIYKSLKAKG
jgi:putative autoinducer-2 (AI-2) aldolase